MTTPTTTIMPSAIALPTFSCPAMVSLVRATRICSGAMMLPWLMSAAVVAYAEKAFANSRSSAPRNGGVRIGTATWRQ